MEQRVQRINARIQQLLRQYQLLQRDNERLQKTVTEYRAKNKVLEESLDALNRQVLVLKAGNGQMNEADKKDLEKRINQYIRKVNQCIAYLGE